MKPSYSPNKKVSTYSLTHEDASYISIHFSDFALPPSCLVEVTNKYEKQKYKMRVHGKFELSSFWARHVDGKQIVLYISNRTHFQVQFLTLNSLR